MNAFGEMQRHLEQCLRDVTLRYFTPEHTLVVSYRRLASNEEKPVSTLLKYLLDITTKLLDELHRTSNCPVLVSSRRYSGLRESHKKHVSYVMFAETGDVVQDVRNQLIDLKTHFGWNPRAKFVVAVVEPKRRLVENSIAEEILNELWDEKIINAIVILSTELSSRVKYTDRLSLFHYEELPALNVYTHFPYQPPGRCGQNTTAVLIDQWAVNKSDVGHFLLNAPLFPDKIPLNFHGCPFTTSTFEFEPLVMKPITLMSDSKLVYSEGLEIRVLNLVMNAVNFSPVYRFPPANGKWGIRFDNGSWNGISGEIIDHLSDVAVCGMVLDNIRSKSADVTVPHAGFEMSWHVPCAKPVSRWASLTRVFTSFLWLGLFLIYAIFSVFMWMTLHVQGAAQRGHCMNLETCFLNLWGVILGVSASNSVPNITVVRFIFLLWIWNSLAANTVYQTFLTSFLVDPGLQDQLNTKDELVNSDLKLGFHSYIAMRFKELLTDRYKRRVISDDMDQCVERLDVEGDLAFFISKFVGGYKASFTFVRSDGKLGFCP
jgi:hypothetical protein